MIRRVGEVAKELGETAGTLRYWEQEFGIRPIRTRNGWRCYRDEDVERMRAVRQCLREYEFTIAGAKRFLARAKKETA